MGSKRHARLKYLEKHGKSVRVVVRVPAHLRPALGVTRLKRSLGRVTMEEAKAMRWAVVAELRAEMAAAESKRPMRRMQEITDYDALMWALSNRRKAMGITQLEMDEEAGLQAGYTGKLESKMKGLGKESLGAVLRTLNVRLVLEGGAFKPRPKRRGPLIQHKSGKGHDAGVFSDAY